MSLKHLLLFLFVIVSCKNQSNNSEYPIWTENDRQYLSTELIKTQKILHQWVDSLSSEQWSFSPNENVWNIKKIVEHLQLQEDMHFREAYVISLQPPLKQASLHTIGNDQKVEAYAATPLKTIADWNVTPLGRWENGDAALMAFDRSRNKMIEFVQTTTKDLRQQITFRNIKDKSDFRQTRNLHQIILTTIAHTQRHLIQIEELTMNPNFPN